MTMTNKTRAARITSIITTWVLRLLVAMTVVFFLAVIITASLGGNGDVQRRSLESVMGNFMGRPTQIHQLNMYRIFPEFRADVENVTAGLPGTLMPDFILGRGVLVKDSLAALWGGPDLIALEIDNLMTQGGVWGPQALHLQTGRIVNETEGLSFFRLVGTYGAYPLTIEVPLRAIKDRYQVLGHEPVRISWGPIKATAMVRIDKKVIMMDPVAITHRGRDFSGQMFIPRAPTPSLPRPFLRVRGTGEENFVDGVIDAWGEPTSITFKAAQGADKNVALLALGLAASAGLAAPLPRIDKEPVRYPDVSVNGARITPPNRPVKAP